MSSHSLSMRHVGLTAGFELKRLFQTKRGLLWLLAFALVWGLLLRYPILQASDLLRNPQMQEFVTALLGDGGIAVLFDWPHPELAVYWGLALLLYPMTAIGLCADQMASDLQRGTLRFLTLRSSRDSLLLGRFLGLMLIQMAMVISSVVATLGLALYNGDTQLMSLLSHALLISLNLMLVLLPFTATMALLSLIAKSGRQAVVLASLFWLFTPLLIGLLAMIYAPLEALRFLVPGGQLGDLIGTSPGQALSLAWLPVAQALLMLVLAQMTLKRTAL
ncbi:MULTISPECIES: ABC transporter permease [Ferrimonas]|uniref:ABC transporter permease n=1 Tax=Ferrimonas TaxID=44011 RepID=UPI000417C660|nr:MULTISPECIES: ABC transporter permease subunit [Ferrimonas]USD38325.1 ABC transporter permease subunit [Ferrimonas sp. SCSIO 43195]